MRPAFARVRSVVLRAMLLLAPFARMIPEAELFRLADTDWIARPAGPVASMMPELPLTVRVLPVMPRFVAEMTAEFVTVAVVATMALPLVPVAWMVPEFAKASVVAVIAVPFVPFARIVPELVTLTVVPLIPDPFAPVASIKPELAATVKFPLALIPNWSAEIVPIFVSVPVVVAMPIPPAAVALTKPEFVRLIALAAKARPFTPFAWIVPAFVTVAVTT